jgi:hypothetical protein
LAQSRLVLEASVLLRTHGSKPTRSTAVGVPDRDEVVGTGEGACAIFVRRNPRFFDKAGSGEALPLASVPAAWIYGMKR